MDSRPEEMWGLASQPNQSASANVDRRVGSGSANISSVNKISVMHALLLSGIELTLIVGNAVNENAFQPSSFSDLIFGGSVVIEAVGVLFAIGMSVRVLLYPFEQDVVGVGVPAIVIAESLFMAGSDKEMGERLAIGKYGLGAQSLCFLVFALISWIKSPASIPSGSRLMPISVFIAFNVLIHACQRRRRDGFSTRELLITMLVSVPFVIEISESALLLTSGSVQFEAYLLAVLDLVVVAPGAAYYLVYLVLFIMEENCTLFTR